MTIKELKQLIEEYPDEFEVKIRIWLQPNKDYLDYEFLTSDIQKIHGPINNLAILSGKYKDELPTNINNKE